MFYSVLAGVVGLLFGRGRYYLVFDRCLIGPSIMAKNVWFFCFRVNVADKMGTQKVFLSRWDGRDSVAELCACCCTWMTKLFYFIFLLAMDKKNQTLHIFTFSLFMGKKKERKYYYGPLRLLLAFVLSNLEWVFLFPNIND